MLRYLAVLFPALFLLTACAATRTGATNWPDVAVYAITIAGGCTVAYFIFRD